MTTYNELMINHENFNLELFLNSPKLLDKEDIANIIYNNKSFDKIEFLFLINDLFIRSSNYTKNWLANRIDTLFEYNNQSGFSNEIKKLRDELLNFASLLGLDTNSLNTFRVNIK